MSLTLTALRLQAIAALNSHPTIAELCDGRVYDSRIGDFDHREPVPVIVVTTEELDGEGFSQNGGAPFDDRCNLVLEIAMNTLVDLDGEAGPAIATPATDGELEATLNLLAWCAEQILTLGRPHPLAQPTPDGALLMRAVTKSVAKRSVSRFSSDETAERLAIHLVTFLVELKTEELDAMNPPGGPFAALPEPLRLVCEAAPAGSGAGVTCRMLAAALAMPSLPRLASAGFTTIPPGGTARPDPGAADFPTLGPPERPLFDPEDQWPTDDM